MRFKEGVKPLNGELRKVSVVRLGRSDAINANVLDVTLDELVGKRLDQSNGKKTNYGEEIHSLVEESRGLTESQNVVRSKMDEARSKGDSVIDLERQYEVQKRRKAQIGQKIDELRDKSTAVSRDAEISRRRVQQEILDGAHIICATLSGSGHEMFQNLSIEFETVVIDEAAQSIELSALIPLKYGCSKCILVGDPKQLPPTVLSREAARFSYEQSLFVRMQVNHPNDVHLLDTQYRMHPEISQYPSQAFYDGKLLDGEEMDSLRQQPWHDSPLLGPYRFFDVQGQHQSASKGHSLINVAEVNVALQLFERLTMDHQDYDFSRRIGIITPYKGQLQELKLNFGRRFGESIFKTVEFNTTDAFQGRESEIIIFSCVRASPSGGIGFLDDIRRMNVGLTRAKSSLWVLGNSRSLQKNEFWGRLIDNARMRDRYTAGDVLALLRQGRHQQNGSSNAGQIPSRDYRSSSSGHPPLSTNGGLEDIEMVDAPEADIRNDQPTKVGNNGSTVSVRQPGPDSNFGCRYCGSSVHTDDACDDPKAICASSRACYRCGEVDHVVGRCAAPCCLRCGAIGHTRESCCSVRSLSKNEQAALRRQERHFDHQKKTYLTKQRQRQLGDHDPQVPTVRTTPATPTATATATAGSIPQIETSQATKRLGDAKASDKRKGVPPLPTDLMALRPVNVSRCVLFTYYSYCLILCL